MNRSKLERLFKFEQPKDVSISKVQKLAKAGRDFAKVINQVTPDNSKQEETIKQVAVVVSNAFEVISSDGE